MISIFFCRSIERVFGTHFKLNEAESADGISRGIASAAGVCSCGDAHSCSCMPPPPEPIPADDGEEIADDGDSDQVSDFSSKGRQSTLTHDLQDDANGDLVGVQWTAGTLQPTMRYSSRNILFSHFRDLITGRGLVKTCDTTCRVLVGTIATFVLLVLPVVVFLYWRKRYRRFKLPTM